MDVKKKLRRAETRDKHLRFSIRKFNVGVASVAVAAFFMVGGSSAAANELGEGVSADAVQTTISEGASSGESSDDAEEGEEPALSLQAEEVEQQTGSEMVTDEHQPVEDAKPVDQPVASVQTSQPADSETGVDALVTEKAEAEVTAPAILPTEEKAEAKPDAKAETDVKSEAQAEDKATDAMRVAATTYRVRYVDVHTGEVVYQRNYSVSEETTTPANQPHDFNLSVALELETAQALDGYELAESQEVTIRDNAIEAIVTERGSNRNLKVLVRQENAGASGEGNEEVEGESGFRATASQSASGATITTALSQRKYNNYTSIVTNSNNVPLMYVVGDGVGPLGITYFGDPQHRAQANTLWTNGTTRAFFERNENGMFGQYAQEPSAGLNIAHQIQMVHNGYGYEQGVDEVNIDFKDYFVLPDRLAAAGFKIKIVDFRETNLPTGLTFDYRTGILSGKVEAGIENGGNYLAIKVALLDANNRAVNGTETWVEKFNIVYQDRTAPELEVTDIYTAVANEKLTIPMVYPTEAEQEKARQEYARGERDFFFNVNDNGWSIPYGDIVRDASGQVTNYIGKQSHNTYYGKADTATTVNTVNYDKNSVLAVDAEVELRDKTIEANTRYTIQYNYENGTLNIESNLAGIYTVTMTANDYRFSREMQATTLTPWNYVTSPQETSKSFTLYINPTIEVSNATTATDSLTVTMSGGATEATVTLPNGQVHRLTERNGVWRDQNGRILQSTQDGNLVQTVTLPVDYKSFTGGAGQDKIQATVGTEDGLSGRATAHVTNTPPTVVTEGGTRQLGTAVDLLSSDFIKSITDTEDDRHNAAYPDAMDGKYTTITSVIVTTPDGQSQTHTGADLKTLSQTLGQSGNYRVDVTVTDSDGLTHSSAYNITVNPLQKANVNYIIRRILPAKIDDNGDVVDSRTGRVLSRKNADGTHDISRAEGAPAKVVLTQEGNAILTPQGTAVFFTDDEGELDRVDSVYGQSDEIISQITREQGTGAQAAGYSTEEVINSYIRRGYELVTDGFDTNAAFDRDDNVEQNFTVILRELVYEVNQNTPPGRPVRPNDPNTPFIPETIRGIVTEEQVTQTIRYLYERDNSIAARPVERTLDFVRKAYVNLVTGEITYGAWSPDPETTNTDTFTEVPSPRVIGYLGQGQDTYSSTRPSVAAYKVTNPAQPDILETVYYSAGNNVAFVQYVDKATGAVIQGDFRHNHLDTVVDYDFNDWPNGLVDTSQWRGELLRGDGDEPIRYSTAATLSELKKRGYVLATPADDELSTAQAAYVSTKNYGAKDPQTGASLVTNEERKAEGVYTPVTNDYQLYRVYLTHATVTITPEDPKKPGDPVRPGEPDSPTYPPSIETAVLTDDVTRTIKYVFENGAEALPSVLQSATFRREAVVDLVTGEILSYSNWSAPQALEEKVSPLIPGYLARQESVPAVTVAAEENNKEETVVYVKLGDYIINVPHTDTPTTATYPNHPTNPTTPGTPTTVVPYVPGFTPKTQDGTPLTPVDSDNPDKGYHVPPVPNDPTQNTVINYTPNEQAALIQYVDETGKELLLDRTTGASEAKIDYSTADRIAELEKKGYELVTDGFVADSTYDTDDAVDQRFVVTLKERVVPITPTATPNTPVDSDKPNTPNWPEIITNKEAVTDTVTRTINYVYDKDGSKAADSQTQTAEFTRTAFVNLVTGELTYGDWSAPLGLLAVPSPTIKGYLASTAEVGTTAVRALDEDITSEVRYIELGSYVFKYEDAQKPAPKASEQYPNSTIDPSRTGEVTTTAPYVKGYYPTYPYQDYSNKIVDVNGNELPLLDPANPEKGFTLNPIDPADLSKGYVVPVIPANVNSNTEITYVGNQQKAIVRYVSKADPSQVLNEPTELTGLTDQVIDTTKPEEVVEYLRGQGWYISRSRDNQLTYGGEKFFDDEDDTEIAQEYVISFIRRMVIIVPTDPNVPRDVIEGLQLEVSGNRTIEYVVEGGAQPAPETVKQTADFERFALVDEKTGELITTSHFLVVHREYDVVDGKITVEGQEYPVVNGSVTFKGEEYPVVDGKALLGNEYKVVDGEVIIEGVTYRDGLSGYVVAEKSEHKALVDDNTKASLPAVPSEVVPGHVITKVTLNGVDQEVKTVVDPTTLQVVVVKPESKDTPNYVPAENVVVTYTPVGKVVIEIPTGQDVPTPTPDPYPNNQEDPTKVDQPKTEVPTVPGFTPVIVENPEDPNSPTKPIPPTGIPVPPNPTEDTVIKYVPNAQNVTINYVNQDKNNVVLHSDQLTGETGKEITYSTAAKIAELIKAGYELVTDGFTPGTTYDNDDAATQVYTVVFKEVVKTIDPNNPDSPKPDPENPDNPVDPADPNSPKWPDTAKNLETVREIKRTITYVDNTGKTVSREVVDTVKFTRPATVNLVTGEVTYGDWTSTTPTYPEVASPVVPGHIADKPVVPGSTVTPADKDSVEKVTYTPVGKVVIEIPTGQDIPTPTPDPYPNNPEDPTKVDQPKTPVPDVPGFTPVIVENPTDPNSPTKPIPPTGIPVPPNPTEDTVIKYVPNAQNVVINYVNQDKNNALLHKDELTGESDTVVTYSTAAKIAELIKAGYELVTDGFTPGTKYDTDDQATQVYTVVFKEVVKTITPDNPNVPTDPTTPPTTPTTPVVPNTPVEPTDPTNPDKPIPNWPDSEDVRNLTQTEEVVRTITYVDADGKEVSTPVTETVEFTRPAKINLVTGVVEYGDWTPKTNGFDPKTNPVVPGYIIDKVTVDGADQSGVSTVPGATVTADSKDIVAVVTYKPVGNVVVEVPGKDEPTKEPYPNKPEDPTAIDQPKTEIPVVPGYTPVIVENPTDPNSPTKPIPPTGIPVPPNPTEDTVIKYVPNAQNVVINYVNQDKNNALLHKDELTGESDTVVTYSTAAKIAELIKAGYELVTDGFTPGTKYDTDDQAPQVYTVVLKEVVKTITPDNPNVPTDPTTPPTTPTTPVVPNTPVEPTDPTNPDKPIPNWPDSEDVRNLTQTEEVVRTITYVDADGKVVSTPVTETVEFTRPATINLVTGVVTYGEWTPKTNGFDPKTNPVVPGYIIDKVTVDDAPQTDLTTVPGATVTADAKDIVAVVTYKPIGKVVVEVPGQDKPTTEPYPNNPEDPTKVDQPKTEIPTVPGFTPVIVENPTDPNSPTKPIPPTGIPVPPNPTEDTVIKYVPNAQNVVINYVNQDKNNALLHKDELTGESDTVVNYSTAAKIAELIKAGYELVTDGFTPGTKFDTNDQAPQVYTVVFKEVVKTVTPDNPNVPTDPTTPPTTPVVPNTPVEPTDPTNPDKPIPNWPDTEDVRNLTQTEEVVRTITYVDADGKEVSTPVTETVEFTRPAEINLVTGAVKYGEWTPKTNGFDPKTNPVVPGYIIDKVTVDDAPQTDLTTVPGATVTADSKDIVAVVTYKPVGNVVVEVPGQDKPTTEPYPNKPEDPTTIDQPKTEIPVVPGYTPVIVENPTDPNSPTTPIPVDETGKPVIPVPNDPTKDTVIRYVANAQDVIINYVDQDKNNELIHSDKVTGESGSIINYSTAAKIAELIAKGYELVTDGFTPGTKYDTDNQAPQVYTVVFKEVVKTITPDNPNVPTDPTTPPTTPVVPNTPVEPTDPTNPDKPIPNWPDSEDVRNLTQTEEVVRTITYVDADGKVVSTPVTETVEFTRPAKINLVTGVVEYGEWTPKTNGFDPKTNPVVPGYIIDKVTVDGADQSGVATVPGATVPADAKDIVAVVTYKPVGKVVVEVPGQDKPTTEPYPNNPEDPTKVDQPKTEVPTVPGFTPVIVENPEDPNSPTKPIPPTGIPVPPNPTEDTVIKYVPNAQNVVINYVNQDKNNALLHKDELTGESDTVVTYSTAAKIAELIKAGYELVTDGFKPGTKFDTDDQAPQVYTVVLKEVVKTITPDNPNVPTDPTTPPTTPTTPVVPNTPVEPTDPTNPDKPIPNWPDSEDVRNLTQTKEITRTITYIDADGKEVSKPVTETVEFTRPAKINLVTGVVEYGEWTPKTNGFDPKTNPVVPGYIIDKVTVDGADQSGTATVPGATVTADSKDIVAVVTYKPVGNVVVEVPGKDEPTKEPYPNKPEDPTTIDQPKTEIPVVPGYTPVIVENPTDPNSPTTPIPVDETGKPVIPVPADPTKDTVIRYVANAQDVIINYVDQDKNNELIHSDKVTGESGSIINYSTAAKIAELIKAGYELVTDGFTPGTKYDTDDQAPQVYTVVFKEVVKTITPDNPNVPTDPTTPPTTPTTPVVPNTPVEPTDPTNPDKPIPNWPDSEDVRNLTQTEEVIRTITYLDADGKVVSTPVTETVEFTRPATINLVTGVVTYGEWTPKTNGFDPKTNPVVPGYIIDKVTVDGADQSGTATVPGATVTADTKDIVAVVTYKPVGKVIVEVPGVPTSTTETYPNNPEDPTKVDQPKTEIPVVPGFTPVIVENPTDPNSPTKPIPVDDNGKPVIPVPADPTKDTVIVYVPSDQKATFTIVDPNGKSVADPISTVGKSGEPITDPTTAKITDLIKSGYEIVSTDFVPETPFDTDEKVDQTFTLVVKPRVETVDPKNPNTPTPKPGEPVDPKDPNSPNWPDTVKDLDTVRDITRTITYVDKDGKVVSTDVVSTVTFTRLATINLVTGEVTYGDWTSTTPTYPEVTSPVVPGYITDKPLVPAGTVTPQDKNTVETVTYKPVGKVIVEVPGVPTPTTETYPNNPGDPTKIDQPKTEIPTVPGFTPVIVENPTDPNSPTKPIPVDDNGKPVIPVPADPTKDTVIRYVADKKGSVIVRYLDANGQPIRPEVVDTETTLLGMAYDTSDNRVDVITSADGTRYVLVPSKTQGSETGLVTEGTVYVSYVYAKVANWVPNVPGQPEVPAIPYPFDPEAEQPVDPTKPGDGGIVPTIPHVPGYVPVDPNGNPLKPVDPIDPTKGYIPPVPADPGVNTVINYKPVTPEEPKIPEKPIEPAQPVQPTTPEVPRPVVPTANLLPETGDTESSAVLLGAALFGAAFALAARKRRTEEEEA